MTRRKKTQEMIDAAYEVLSGDPAKCRGLRSAEGLRAQEHRTGTLYVSMRSWREVSGAV
jgi:hypothetical protein